MRTRWLAERRIRVADIVRVDDRADQVAVLSEALPGTPAEASALPVPRLIEALATAIAAIHSLPSEDCPFDESIATRLSRATASVTADQVDPDEFAPRNRGVTPTALLTRLVDTQPPEDTVVVHGDATLSNLIIDRDGNVGFIDCGNAGRGDRYVDLAVLSQDILEHFGDAAAVQFAKSYSDRSWDRTKARYFLDLYELF